MTSDAVGRASVTKKGAGPFAKDADDDLLALSSMLTLVDVPSVEERERDEAGRTRWQREKV